MDDAPNPASAPDAPDDGYYYDAKTGEVSRGPRHSWQHRMGPYATVEEAARALEIARERTRAWDEEDERGR